MSQDEGAGDPGFEQFERFLEEWSRRDFLRNMGAGAAYLAFLAGGVEFLAACGGGTSSTGPTVKEGGHIVEVSTSDLKNFNSVLTNDYTSDQMISMINDGLFTIDANAQSNPMLAKQKPIVSSDNLTYTVPMRQDVQWTDGNPVTADDVVFTYQLMYDPAFTAVNSPRRGTLSKYIQSVTAKDKYTVVFQTKSVFAPFVASHMNYAVLPKHVLGSLSPTDINSAPWNAAPTVTNGAFKFVSWDKGSQVTLAKNPKYYRGAPHLDTYIFKIGIVSTAVLDALKTGEVDVAYPGIGPIDASQFAAAQGVDNITVYSYPRLTFDFYMYQLDPAKPASKFFSDKSVRQALYYALDRKAIAHALYFDQATVANTSMPPKSWAYNPDNKPVYDFNKAKAQSMLDAAGWAVGSGGIRQKNGDSLKFEMITNAGNKIRENLLVVMQQQWKDIGVDATPKYVDFNKVLVPALTNTRQFDVLMVGFSWDVDPDQSQVWHSRNAGPGGFNGMHYMNPDLDKVLDDAVGTLDQAKRKQLYFQMQQILAEDVPAPILTFPNGLLSLNKRVQNWQYGTFIGQGGRRNFIKDLFVSDGK
ncbi:MAG TPA: ABC transporter substrate-binding protein [Candidatus Dormibacteraeota bacterium]|nr:ABC transporter substrate-binding protein [Candidatus Dormibacteraeota bacterium]